MESITIDSGAQLVDTDDDLLPGNEPPVATRQITLHTELLRDFIEAEILQHVALVQAASGDVEFQRAAQVASGHFSF